MNEKAPGRKPSAKTYSAVNITEILSIVQARTGAAKKSPSGWQARCPAHEDKNPSLSISEGDDGRTLLHCQAGCTVEAVCAAIGIGAKDLFPVNGATVKPRLVCAYDYHDRDGNLVFQVCRFDPKDFRQRRPDGNGGWIKDVKGFQKVLYRLPEVREAVAECLTVYLVEGEKDADALAKLGLCATCNPGGANKWEPGYTETLTGADVVIFPDKDTPGRKHAAMVQSLLTGKANMIRVVELPDRDGRKVKDAADWIATGGTRAELERLVAIAPDWTPPGEVEVEAESSLPPIKNMAELLADESIITPSEIVKGVLHKGCKLILGGSSKSKKTFTLLDLALAVSTGTPFWVWDTTKGRVLYLNLEILEPFIRARVLALAQAKGIKQADLTGFDVWNLRGHVCPAAEMVQRVNAATTDRHYSLVIVDPIYKLSPGKDENSAGDMGELVNRLEQIPNQTGAALAYAHHYSKGNQSAKESIDRISGSGVFARDCDSLVTMTKHEVEDAFTIECTLRNHPEQTPFVVEWGFPIFKVRQDLDPAKLRQVKGRAPTHAVADILAVLKKHGELSTGDWEDECKDGLAMSHGTFAALKRQSIEHGLVMRSVLNKKWSVK